MDYCYEKEDSRAEKRSTNEQMASRAKRSRTEDVFQVSVGSLAAKVDEYATDEKQKAVIKQEILRQLHISEADMDGNMKISLQNCVTVALMKLRRSRSQVQDVIPINSTLMTFAMEQKKAREEAETKKRKEQQDDKSKKRKEMEDKRKRDLESKKKMAEEALKKKAEEAEKKKQEQQENAKRKPFTTAFDDPSEKVQDIDKSLGKLNNVTLTLIVQDINPDKGDQSAVRPQRKGLLIKQQMKENPTFQREMNEFFGFHDSLMTSHSNMTEGKSFTELKNISAELSLTFIADRRDKQKSKLKEHLKDMSYLLYKKLHLQGVKSSEVNFETLSNQLKDLIVELAEERPQKGVDSDSSSSASHSQSDDSNKVLEDKDINQGDKISTLKSLHSKTLDDLINYLGLTSEINKDHKAYRKTQKLLEIMEENGEITQIIEEFCTFKHQLMAELKALTKEFSNKELKTFANTFLNEVPENQKKIELARKLTYRISRVSVRLYQLSKSQSPPVDPKDILNEKITDETMKEKFLKASKPGPFSTDSSNFETANSDTSDSEEQYQQDKLIKDPLLHQSLQALQKRQLLEIVSSTNMKVTNDAKSKRWKLLAEVRKAATLNHSIRERVIKSAELLKQFKRRELANLLRLSPKELTALALTYQNFRLIDGERPIRTRNRLIQYYVNESFSISEEELRQTKMPKEQPVPADQSTAAAAEKDDVFMEDLAQQIATLAPNTKVELGKLFDVVGNDASLATCDILLIQDQLLSLAKEHAQVANLLFNFCVSEERLMRSLDNALSNVMNIHEVRNMARTYCDNFDENTAPEDIKPKIISAFKRECFNYIAPFVFENKTLPDTLYIPIGSQTEQLMEQMDNLGSKDFRSRLKHCTFMIAYSK